MYGSLDISASGLAAERTRMTVISANLAGRDALLDAQGNLNPYRRRHAIFAPGNPSASTRDGRALGVHVKEIWADQDAIRLKHDPSHPLAYTSGPDAGYVPVPDIDPITEQVDAMTAMRAYEANIASAEATKAMLGQALRLIA